MKVIDCLLEVLAICGQAYLLLERVMLIFGIFKMKINPMKRHRFEPFILKRPFNMVIEEDVWKIKKILGGFGEPHPYFLRMRIAGDLRYLIR